MPYAECNLRWVHRQAQGGMVTSCALVLTRPVRIEVRGSGKGNSHASAAAASVLSENAMEF